MKGAAAVWSGGRALRTLPGDARTQGAASRPRGRAAADTLVVETVRDPARWAALDSLWHELLDAIPDQPAAEGGASTCFMTHAWLTTWWQHLPASLGIHCRPLLILVWQGTRLVGAAPLMVARSRRRGPTPRRLMFIGAGASDYQRVLVSGSAGVAGFAGSAAAGTGAPSAGSAAVLRALARQLVAERRAWDVLELDEYDGRDPHLSQWLAALAEAGCRVRVTPASPCAGLAVTGDWDDFYTGRAGGERRKKYRKAWRRLAESGAVEVELRDYVARDDALLGELAALERAHPGAAGERPGLFNAPGYASFMRAVVPARARGGEVLVAVLRVSGRALAYLLFFVRQGRAAAYATAYHGAWRHASPGALLLRHALEQLRARGISAIDFNRGAQAYKSLWLTATRDNLRIRAWHGGWRARLHAHWSALRAGGRCAPPFGEQA